MLGRFLELCRITRRDREHLSDVQVKPLNLVVLAAHLLDGLCIINDIPGAALVLALDLQRSQSLLDLHAFDTEPFVLCILVHHQLTLSALVGQLGCFWLGRRAWSGLDGPLFQAAPIVLQSDGLLRFRGAAGVSGCCW